jgi:hypothetical protein
MTKMRLSIILGTAALVAQSPLSAQPTPKPTGPAGPSTFNERHPNRETFSREYDTKIRLKLENQPVATYVQAKAVAACLANRNKKDAGSLVGGFMTSDTNFDALTRALSRKYQACVTEDAVGVPMAYINDALAEELVRRQNPALQDRVVPADAAAAKGFYATLDGLTMDTLGRCFAVYSPGLAYRVLATGAGTPSESAALASLFSSTPECGVPASPKDIPAVEQRGAVAAGLYHWTHRG